MRHPYLASFFVVASVAALAACGETPTAAPNPQVARSMTSSPSTSTCDINGLKSNARAYASSDRDALFPIISDLHKLVKHGPTAAGTDKAFDGLARLAEMRGTSAQLRTATGTTFNALTLGFLGCMESYISSNLPGDFSVAGALNQGWMYEVRGGASDTAAGAYERGESPYWAAEAPRGWTVASGSQAKRFLIYGYRLTDFLTNDPQIGSAFEVSTIPTIGSGKLVLGSPLTIGECGVDVTNTLRVQHVASVLTETGLVCDDAPAFASAASSLRMSGSAPLRFAQRALDFFAPRQLEAAMRIGSVGGAGSVLSPFALIDMQSVGFVVLSPVASGVISRPLAGVNGSPVQVRVQTLGGTPLGGATVTLGIDRNRSSIAYLRDGNAAPSSSVSRTTDNRGIATFDNVYLTKAGGYTLSVSGGFDGVLGVSTLSNLFNMKNK